MITFIRMEEQSTVRIPTMAELRSEGITPEILFWVGCAGSFDARAQKVSQTLAKLLSAAGIEFAILGAEEQCTGDPARRSGNEFLFQSLALQNVRTLNGYGIRKIVTACPHCFNTLKNEYPELGGNYEVLHHSQLIRSLVSEGRLRVKGANYERMTYHDSCYLGRMNGVYEVPRELLEMLEVKLVEMARSREGGLCCGAGGAQMFKEDEPGRTRINTERVAEIMETRPAAVVANCPFCITMLTDGLQEKDAGDEIAVYDISELILNNLIH